MTLTRTQDADPRTIHLYQGATWRGVFTWMQPVPDSDPVEYEPADLTGYTGEFTLYTKPGGTVLLTVTSPDGDDGGIDIDIDAGTLTPHLNAAQTAAVLKDGAYELRAVSVADPNEVARVSAGYMNVILAGEPWPYPAVTA